MTSGPSGSGKERRILVIQPAEASPISESTDGYGVVYRTAFNIFDRLVAGTLGLGEQIHHVGLHTVVPLHPEEAQRVYDALTTCPAVASGADTLQRWPPDFFSVRDPQIAYIGRMVNPSGQSELIGYFVGVGALTAMAVINRKDVLTVRHVNQPIPLLQTHVRLDDIRPFTSAMRNIAETRFADAEGARPIGAGW